MLMVRKSKAKVEPEPEKEPEAVKETKSDFHKRLDTAMEKDDESIEPEEPSPEDKPAESIPPKEDKPAESIPPEEDTPTEPEETPAEEYTDEKLIKVPCRCMKCSAEFHWTVPRGIGTPLLVFTECKKCRGF